MAPGDSFATSRPMSLMALAIELGQDLVFSVEDGRIEMEYIEPVRFPLRVRS